MSLRSLFFRLKQSHEDSTLNWCEGLLIRNYFICNNGAMERCRYELDGCNYEGIASSLRSSQWQEFSSLSNETRV